MGGRYLITGTQLGMIKGLLVPYMEKQGEEIINLLDEIIEKQHVGNSENPVEEDVEMIFNTDWDRD